MDEPLIHTIHGNMPVKDLTRVDGWDFDPSGITYWQEHKLGNEVVRRDVSRYQLQGSQTLGTQGAING
jgi:hypothetical protein